MLISDANQPPSAFQGVNSSGALWQLCGSPAPSRSSAPDNAVAGQGVSLDAMSSTVRCANSTVQIVRVRGRQSFPFSSRASVLVPASVND
ncbi:unnamed protein product [Arctogadus glacialis]